MKELYKGNITDDYWSSKSSSNKVDVVKERAFTFNKLLKKGKIKKILKDNLNDMNSAMDDIQEAIDQEGTFDVDFMTHSERERLEDFIRHRIKEKIKGL